MPESNMWGGWDDFEEAWSAFVLSEATGWTHLPYPGGLMDQPELLMRNLFRIRNIVEATRSLPSLNKPAEQFGDAEE